MRSTLKGGCAAAIFVFGLLAAPPLPAFAADRRDGRFNGEYSEGARGPDQRRDAQENQIRVRQRLDDDSRRGPRNLANVRQDGRGLSVSVQQDGSGNVAIVRQIGTGNIATVTQTGNNNVVRIKQCGDGLTAAVSQVGDGGRLRVTQGNCGR